jgi:hypothetical protein
MMKKNIALFFLFAYLFSTTHTIEFLKIPILLSHYKEHKGENKNLSFFDFLVIHYGNGFPKDADFDKDMKLPFKSIPSSNTFSVAFFATSDFFCKEKQQDYFKFNKNLFFEYRFNYSCLFLNTIWQPPRNC